LAKIAHIPFVPFGFKVAEGNTMPTKTNQKHRYFWPMARLGKDWYGYARKQGAAKLWNASKIVGSYYLSRVTGRPYVAGLPMSISFEPTTACNLRCPECPSGLRSFSRPTGNLRLELFKQVMDEVK